VLKQKDNVADAGFFAEGDQLFLQALGGGVVNGAELEKGNQNLAMDLHGLSRI
jgi:hypothetical protein